MASQLGVGRTPRRKRLPACRPGLSELTPRLLPRLGDYWVTVYRRTWRGSVITSFLMPFLYLTAMGIGLGSFVDDNAGPRALGGISYLAFIAPGLLATSAMQTAIGEMTYPVMGAFKWHRVYFSMAATPLRVADVVGGQLAFAVFRIFLTCAVFLGVLAGFGALDNPAGGVAALLVVVLLGAAHATPVMALTARMKSESGFALVYRLGLMPMFLFSGAFFPISQLPGAIGWLARVTPIWHGVELTRMLTLGDVHAWAAVGHLCYLVVLLLAGWYLSVTGFAKRLAQ
ncbi:MAG: ABC transporter permease [Nocardioidaceae bacterium]